MCHILKTLTEVEGIDEVYVFAATKASARCCPRGSGCCSATRRSTATRRSDGRFTTASPPGSGPTSTSSPTPPRRSSAPRPLPMRSAKCVRANTTRRSAPKKSRTFAWVRRPSAQLRSRQHPPHADHRAGLHRDQRLLHLFAGVVVRPRPPHRRSSLHGRRGPHRGFGHRLPRGLRHGRNHRGEPEPTGINKKPILRTRRLGRFSICRRRIGRPQLRLAEACYSARSIAGHREQLPENRAELLKNESYDPANFQNRPFSIFGSRS